MVALPSARAFEVGFNAGMASAGGTSFAWGGNLGWDMGPLTVGPKFALYSAGGISYTDILGQFKLGIGGLFVALTAGVYLGSGTGPLPSFSGLVGPSAGYYFGAGLKFGGEIDYLFPTAAGGQSAFLAMAGIKFGL